MSMTDTPIEQVQGSVERVTFHSEETGFCVLRTKVKGHRDLVTVIGNAAHITAGEYIECQGIWINDRKLQIGEWFCQILHFGLELYTPAVIGESDSQFDDLWCGHAALLRSTLTLGPSPW